MRKILTLTDEKKLYLKTILLVEAVDLLREMIRDFLDSKGFTIIVAENADEALGTAKNHVGTIDLLLIGWGALDGVNWMSLLKIGQFHPELRNCLYDQQCN